MGYYTQYKLSLHEGTADMKLVLKTIARIMDIPAEYAPFETFDIINNALISTHPMKWYDHDTDCAELSKLFFDVVFELNGVGETADDIWRCFYKNGNIQICRAHITFNSYQEQSLLSVEAAHQKDEKNLEAAEDSL